MTESWKSSDSSSIFIFAVEGRVRGLRRRDFLVCESQKKFGGVGSKDGDDLKRMAPEI